MENLEKEQIEEIVHEYIKNNLRIDVTKSREYGYGGEMETYVELEIFIGDDLVSSHFL